MADTKLIVPRHTGVVHTSETSYPYELHSTDLGGEGWSKLSGPFISSQDAERAAANIFSRTTEYDRDGLWLVRYLGGSNEHYMTLLIPDRTGGVRNPQRKPRQDRYEAPVSMPVGTRVWINSSDSTNIPATIDAWDAPGYPNLPMATVTKYTVWGPKTRQYHSFEMSPATDLDRWQDAVTRANSKAVARESNPAIYGVNIPEFRSMSAREAGRATGEAWNRLRGVFRPGWEQTQHSFKVWKGTRRALPMGPDMDEFKAGIRETYRPTPERNPYPGSGCPHTHFTELSQELGKPLAAWIERRKHGAGWPRHCESNPNRFVPESMMVELANLWHLSRVHSNSRYERLLWTSQEFHKLHPELSPTAIYKDLDAWDMEGARQFGRSYSDVGRGRGRRRNPEPGRMPNASADLFLFQSSKTWNGHDLLDIKHMGERAGLSLYDASGVDPKRVDPREITQAFKIWAKYDGLGIVHEAPAEDVKLIQRAWTYGYRNAMKARDRNLGYARNPQSDAAALYETFHGAPSEEVLELHDTIKYHSNLTVLGDLTELKVRLGDNPKGKGLVITFDVSDGVKLCSNESGTQLYIEGGDQSLDLDKLNLSENESSKESIVLGPLQELTYRTRKHFHKFKLTDYYHQLGEETGHEPLLVYDVLNSKLMVSGGAYVIKPEGIVN